MNRFKYFLVIALCSFSCAPISANDTALQEALNQYENAALFRNIASRTAEGVTLYTAACANLLVVVQNASYEDVQRAHETVCSITPQPNHFLYSMAAILSIVPAVSDYNPLPLIYTGIHAFSSRGDNGWRLAANVLAGISVAHDVFRTRWTFNHCIAPEFCYVEAAEHIYVNALLYLLTFLGDYEKRTIAEQHDLLLKKLQDIIVEKAPQQTINQ